MKENVYFVVDNSNNISRQNSGGKSVFSDDCGAWSDSSSTKKHHYTCEHGSPVYVELKNNLFAKYQAGGKKLPLNPQPKMDDIPSPGAKRRPRAEVPRVRVLISTGV